MSECTAALIMAAGDGTRMKSRLSKVLHTVCGKPMISYIVQAASAVSGEKPVVIVSRSNQEEIQKVLGDAVQYALQDMDKGRGTGQAVRSADGFLRGKTGRVLILPGDHPLADKDSLEALLSGMGDAAAALLTMESDSPEGHGRIIRAENGDVAAIVEERDLTAEQRALREINVSMYCFSIEKLLSVLPSLENNNAAGEYYLPDAIHALRARGEVIRAVPLQDADAARGVNDRVELQEAEAAMQARICRAHMLAGVSIINPAHTYIGPDVRIGQDTVIYPGNHLSGNTSIGENVILYPNNRLVDSSIGDNTTAEGSVLLEAGVGRDCTVGPYAYLRPGSVIADHCRIGDFVEIKNAQIGEGTKVSHLTYVGDADLGRNINLGCGTVFSNYDGKKKHRTVVEDNAFIGCNTNLVPPLRVGRGAYIAAGATVTRDIPPDALVVARQRETIKDGWAKKRREEGKL